MATQQVLVLNSEKKHSVRYDASKSDADPSITSVYIMKSALTVPYPKSVLITIEPR